MALSFLNVFEHLYNILYLGFILILIAPNSGNKTYIRNVWGLTTGLCFVYSLFLWGSITLYLNINKDFFTLNLLYKYLYFWQISVWFILLCTFIFVLCMINNLKRKIKIKEFILLFLVLEFFLIKAFSTINLIEFYIYFEGVLLPMFAIILLWGSGERRILASYYLFLYTVICSLLMLTAIFYVGLVTGTYNIVELHGIIWPLKIELCLWFCFFLGFAVKIPMFPFHLWLPEAHVEAPTDGSVILASLLLKLGGYGFIQISLPLFNVASKYFTPLIYTLAVLSIIYASLTALRQVDLKKIIAYSSIAHMNLVVLGIFSFKLQGLTGAIFLMLAHGIVSGALFFLVGILYERHHTRLIHYYGGIVQIMPLFSFFFISFILANLSIPGTCNFIGELLIFVGVFQYNTMLAFFCGFGIVLSAAYSIWVANRLIFGSLNLKYISSFLDLNLKEFSLLLPLWILTVYLGIFPNTVLNNFWFLQYIL